MTEDRRASVAAFVGLLLAILVVVGVLSSWRPPEPVSAKAPDDAFSAERAQLHVERLGRAPRPLGAAAHAASREYLVEELRALGLRPEVQEVSVVRRLAPDRFLAARVRNVVARLEGSGEGEGALMFLSHYDSRPTTPGAGDALSAVATVLEALRALRAGPPLANDLIVLVSDGEEIGLLGARAFVDQHRWAKDVGLVLNFEARGNRGPSPMFETRSGNLAVIRGFAASVPYPYASSLSYEVYRRMPNDSDYSVFRDAGVQGLNMAFIGNLAAYHTRLDSPANLDLGSLQHQGSYALALARHFGNAELAELADASGPDAVYFNPYPWQLVVYPGSLSTALAVAGLVLVLVSLAVFRRRYGAGLGGVARGLGLLVIAVGGSAAVGWCFWWLIRTYLAVLRGGPYGQPYEVATLTVSVLLFAVALVAMVSGWFLSASRELELGHGIWLAWGLLGLAVAFALPGASYLIAWPVFAGVLGLLVASSLGAGSPFLRHLLPTLGGIVALVLLAPTVWMMAQALTLSASAAIGALLGLGLTPVAPALGRIHRASGSVASWALVVGGLALLSWTVWRAVPDPKRPCVDTLAYAVDTGSGEAWWASFDAVRDEWTDEWLGVDADRRSAPPAFALDRTQVLLGAAEPVALSAPVVELVADDRDRGRKVETIVRSLRGAAVLRIRAEASVPLRSVGIEGEEFVFEGDPDAEGLGEIWITAYGFEGDGVRTMFEIEGDRPWPIELDLVDQSWGFGALPKPPAPRPPILIPSSSWRTDSVYVRASTLL